MLKDLFLKSLLTWCLKVFQPPDGFILTLVVEPDTGSGVIVLEKTAAARAIALLRYICGSDRGDWDSHQDFR